MLWIPTAFTPNGDGLNDTFTVKGIRIEEYHIQIFDRWGEKVFENSDPEIGWDGMFNGRICPIGVYTYMITAKDLNAKAINASGSIHLMR